MHHIRLANTCKKQSRFTGTSVAKKQDYICREHNQHINIAGTVSATNTNVTPDKTSDWLISAHEESSTSDPIPISAHKPTTPRIGPYLRTDQPAENWQTHKP